MTARVALTYRDYEALPNDGKRYEIHDGELSVTPAPGSQHQLIIGRLHLLLAPYVTTRGLGVVVLSPLDVLLADTTIVQPDLVYLDSARQARLVPRGVEGPPTLAIEVVSPSSSTIDRRTKRQLYARHGVPHFWLVDPDGRTIEGFVLHGSEYELAVRAAGATPVDLPPFVDLGLVPDSLWP
jgi:Uma2 family endonuclease